LRFSLRKSIAGRGIGPGWRFLQLERATKFKPRMEYMAKKSKQKGVTVVEYAIMLALIAIAVAVAAPNITSAVIGVFSKASSVMQ
jgi:Flp pilus assembly pilin Flp